MAWAELSEAQSNRLVAHSFDNQFADHLHEARVRADRGATDHVHSQLVADIVSFDIQIEHDFHVIRNEADRRDHDIGDAAPTRLADRVADIRFEPRLLRGTAAALEHQFP